MKASSAMLIAILAFLYILHKPNNAVEHLILDFDQFDSLCITDSIPRNISTWQRTEFVDDSCKLKVQFTFDKGDTVFYITEFIDNSKFSVEKVFIANSLFFYICH